MYYNEYNMILNTDKLRPIDNTQNKSIKEYLMTMVDNKIDRKSTKK